MSIDYLIFNDVSFSYDAITLPLLKNINVHFNRGWTGIIGANGAGKTTLLRLASGELVPGQGQVSGSEDAIYCRQRTDNVPLMLNDLVNSNDSPSCRIKGQLGVKSNWYERWDTLSHGERKRAQIAVAVWLEPAILAVDEPTNHLDYEARNHLYYVLKSFNGIGLIVSHDRELLDTLCHQCLFVEPPTAYLRSGNYTRGLIEKEKEDENLKNLYKFKKGAYIKLKKETSKRRDIASQSHRMRSKGGLDIKDHDSRFKKNLARITNKDGTGGKLLNQLDGRLKQAKEELGNIKVKKKYELGIWIPGAKSGRDYLFNLKRKKIDFGGGGSLSFPDLLMFPDDRIALTGLNGTGKSTLISYLVDSLRLDEDKLTFIPQEISRKSSKDIMQAAKRLSGSKLGKMMAVVSRLGSRPERLLESLEPSPGEIRKVMLASGIANEPHLIIMDEPTNHMDLPSIECLEKALDECLCGLLLVSHDTVFLEKLTSKTWHISRKEEGKDQFVLNVL